MSMMLNDDVRSLIQPGGLFGCLRMPSDASSDAAGCFKSLAALRLLSAEFVMSLVAGARVNRNENKLFR